MADPVKRFPAFMESEVEYLCSLASWIQPTRSHSFCKVSFTPVLKSLTAGCLFVFLKDFQLKLDTFLSSAHARRLVIFCEENKLWSFSSCACLHHPVIFRSLCLIIFSSELWSNAFNVHASFSVRALFLYYTISVNFGEITSYICMISCDYLTNRGYYW